jgi:hypothetical protein
LGEDAYFGEVDDGLVLERLRDREAPAAVLALHMRRLDDVILCWQ